MPKDTNRTCPDCVPSRRDFLKTTVATAAAASAAATGIITVLPRSAPAAAVASQPETLVAALYKTLTDAQKKVIAFPFDHDLRQKINNNWFITDKPIKELFDKDQQAIIR